MLEFRTQYDRIRVRTDPGSPIKIKYRSEYDKNGVLQIVECGKEDMTAYINSFKESTDINVILKRYCNGEVDVLSQRQGVFADFTDMPKTYAELLNRIVEGEHIFAGLPVDVRSQFNNSFSEFISQFGTESWLEKMNVQLMPAEEKPKEGADDES